MTAPRSAADNYPGSPFVGREPELAALREALASALDGHGRIVLLAGEPGIGKTRTAEEVLSEARAGGAEVLWGRCQDWEGAPAYSWPWLQILRRYVERTDDETIRSDLIGIAGDLVEIMPELEVLACLVRGSTDREIADELSISPRTVQVHVSNSVGKLEPGSRTAAAAPYCITTSDSEFLRRRQSRNPIGIPSGGCAMRGI